MSAAQFRCRTLLAAVVVTAPALGGPLAVGDSLPLADRMASLNTVGNSTLAAGSAGLLAAWLDGRRVYARAFAADGHPLSDSQAITPVGRDRFANAPRAVALADGRYVLAWVEPTRWLVPDRVRARLVDALGEPLGAIVEVGERDDPWFDEDALVHPGDPAVVVEATGTLLFAWSHGGRVAARRFGAFDGTLTPTVFPSEATMDLGRGRAPHLAALPGGFIAAWLDGNAVQARVFAFDGTPRGPQHELSALAVSPPSVAADSRGSAVAAWAEVDLDETELRVRAQRLSLDGLRIGGPVEVATRSNDLAVDRRGVELGGVAKHVDGSFLVSWTEGTRPCEVIDGYGTVCWDYLTSTAPYARAFAADGSPLATDTRLPAGDADALTEMPVPTAYGWWVPLAGSSLAAVPVAPACGEGGACLGGRFRVEAEWTTDEAEGQAQPLSLTADTVAFWFFSSGNVELVVKVVDGTAVNGHHWVFYASLTDVAFDLTVVDHQTGERRTYHNPAGTMASRADVEAFR